MPDMRQDAAPAASTIVASPPRRQPKAPDPCTMILFGAGGDLTKRLVLPGLYNLARTHLLPQKFALIGVDIADKTVDQWRSDLRAMMQTFVGNASSEFNIDKIDEDAWSRLADRMSYVQGDLTKPDVFKDLTTKIAEIAEQFEIGENCLFYLAVADRFFAPAIDGLGAAKLTDEAVQDGKPTRWRRVVIEKPFGHSLESARALNSHILRTLDERQIFRIDHFLGKETVQNIMALRFANGMFEPIWNRERIDHIQITVAETVGVEKRGKFYEVTGALRDMVPNHMFQLLAMVTMEPPSSFDAEAIRSRKADVFRQIPSPGLGDAVRGQYAAGEVIAHDCVAYRDEPDVAFDSAAETYVALRLTLDNWRWAGVPFYLRTGKHLSQRMSEIAIQFKQAPYAPFDDTPVTSLRPNWLVIRIQPGEGISLQFEVKRPGPVVDLAAVRMEFQYKDWFPREPNVGYETLLYDVMIGDATLFQRADMVEETWRVVQPILDAWASEKPTDFPNYPSGSAGPQAADALIARGGDRAWRPIRLDDA
jgi:glucose-6-phosphate 1-dehydrogenase